VTEWLKYESARIYTGLDASDEDREARRLVDWIAGRGGSVTIRELTHSLWAFRGDAAGAHTALDKLVKSGVGRWVRPTPGLDGGRPTERFELPRLNDITITETPSDDAVSGGFGDGDVGDGSDDEGANHAGSDASSAPDG